MAEIEPAEIKPVEAGGPSTPAAPVAEKPRTVRQWLRSIGNVDSSGKITVVLATVPNGEEWFIERMSVKTSSTTSTAFNLYAGVAEDAYRLDSASPGNDGIADEASPIWVPGGTDIIGVWTGASATDVNSNVTVGRLNAQVRVGE